MNLHGAQFEYLEHVGSGTDWHTEPHSLPSHEAIVVNSGSLAVHAGGDSLVAAAGDVLLFPAGLVHSEQSVRTNPADCHRLTFSLPGLAHRKLARIRDERGVIRTLIALMWDDDMANLMHDVKMNALTQAIAAEFLGNFREWRETDIVMSVRSYVQTRMKDRITLEDMARHVQMSKSHFVRTYRGLTGCTPMDDLRLARLEHAGYLLLNSPLSVKEIACEVGLATQQKLSALFQEELGTTPTLYRNRPKQMSAPPAFPCDGEGNLVVFARGENGGYGSVCQIGSQWSKWSGIGMSGHSMKMVANARGQLEAFAVSQDGTLWHGTRVDTNGEWAQWSPFGIAAAQADAILNADGRIEVFAVVPGGNVRNRFETAPGGPWSPWGNIGGAVGCVTVGTNEDGRIEVFGIGEDGMPTHKWRTNVWLQWKGAPPEIPVAPETSREWAEWNGWLTMACLARQIVVARNPDGRLELFAVTFTYGLCHRWQVAPNSPWSGFAKMPGMATELAIALGADGNINLFAIGRNRQVLHNRKAAGWTGWQSMGAAAMHIAVGKHTDGRLHLFAVTPERNLVHSCQTAPDGAWGKWSTIPAPPLDSF